MDPLTVPLRRVAARVVGLRNSYTRTARALYSTRLNLRETMLETEAQVRAEIEAMARVQDIHLIGEPTITWRCQVTWDGLEKPKEVPSEVWHETMDRLVIDPDRVGRVFELDVPVDESDFSK